MSNDNILKFMTSSSSHIANLNSIFKNIKSEIVADFICSDQHGLIITTNKVTLPSDLSAIENYIKNVNNIKSNNIMTPWLLQSKFYLKIIGIPYLMKNANTPIYSGIIEAIIKNMYIFNDVTLASKLWIIKTSPKSNMAIIWVDI